MSLKILFSARPGLWDDYEAPFRAALDEAGIVAELGPGVGPPETVDYIVYAPNPDLRDFAPYTRLKAVLSLWAGVETIAGNETLTAPLTRMADPGLKEGMTEWVMGHVLHHHLNIGHALARQSGTWEPYVPPLARERRVAVLGLGELGGAVARALAALGFDVSGWSRRPREIEGVRCVSGPDGLTEALAGAHFVICLLPGTPKTESIVDTAALGSTAPGAVLINPGRGTLIDDDAVIEALDAGQLGHAVLDVFRTEPLPETHPFWAHTGITVTPHVASETRPTTAARFIAENIRRSEDGKALLALVDRASGY
ncbi:glyoxylate/hydroxypyruvate reductase A [Roseicyclus sp. F158]|uniref:Glyoxylate/hydroxypyruvate reductase A n=1 Tax=Tropicimonas omnivorans TaxID=3075590 RepID=A0ABU3DDI6_9RHOB|nr:glyoxylate/hydroxypyruvate reductase A [Roseicyclus sp. F158]MDT0681774.1 glyoxylate/hydroxypyruvate reductase A [Roseicyclus sp. F158]